MGDFYISEIYNGALDLKPWMLTVEGTQRVVKSVPFVFGALEDYESPLAPG